MESVWISSHKCTKENIIPTATKWAIRGPGGENSTLGKGEWNITWEAGYRIARTGWCLFLLLKYAYLHKTSSCIRLLSVVVSGGGIVTCFLPLYVLQVYYNEYVLLL